MSLATHAINLDRRDEGAVYATYKLIYNSANDQGPLHDKPSMFFTFCLPAQEIIQ